MWTKIEKGAGKQRGRKPRRSFGVVFTGRTFILLIPVDSGFAAGEALDFYETDGAIGFKLSEGGYKVFQGPRETFLRAVIPAAIAHHFPKETTDLEIIRDGDMYVIDLSQFPTQGAAQ